MAYDVSKSTEDYDFKERRHQRTEQRPQGLPTVLSSWKHREAVPKMLHTLAAVIAGVETTDCAAIQERLFLQLAVAVARSKGRVRRATRARLYQESLNPCLTCSGVLEGCFRARFGLATAACRACVGVFFLPTLFPSHAFLRLAQM